MHRDQNLCKSSNELCAWHNALRQSSFTDTTDRRQYASDQMSAPAVTILKLWEMSTELRAQRWLSHHALNCSYWITARAYWKVVTYAILLHSDWLRVHRLLFRFACFRLNLFFLSGGHHSTRRFIVTSCQFARLGFSPSHSSFGCHESMEYLSFSLCGPIGH